MRKAQHVVWCLDNCNSRGLYVLYVSKYNQRKRTTSSDSSGSITQGLCCTTKYVRSLIFALQPSFLQPY